MPHPVLHYILCVYIGPWLMEGQRPPASPATLQYSDLNIVPLSNFPLRSKTRPKLPRSVVVTHTATTPPLTHTGAGHVYDHPTHGRHGNAASCSTPTTPGANSQDITPYFVRIGEILWLGSATPQWPSLGAILHNWATARVERNLYVPGANLLANDASSSHRTGKMGLPAGGSLSLFCPGELGQPPPAHMGIPPPYQLDSKLAAGLARTPMYPFPGGTYPYPMLSPEMSQVAASWHTPSMYPISSAASGFRSPYPTSLPISSSSLSSELYRFSPTLGGGLGLGLGPALVPPPPSKSDLDSHHSRYAR
ncbi:unnamed protein product [Chrysodeixis includens]|uniref:Uncharacterized protein n=1 Tax=Chrysodeixis includens TaxID=689277 RepID=A0A9N8L0K4_CHRIL|nr:unnamed protein product [Chrysodeixis includens]